MLRVLIKTTSAQLLSLMNLVMLSVLITESRHWKPLC